MGLKIRNIKSTDVRGIYQAEYFLKRVDGFDQFDLFDGTQETLFARARRNFGLLSIKSGEYFLDVGCGRGEVVIAAGLVGAYATGCDFSLSALFLASRKAIEIERHFGEKAKVLFVCGSATEIRFINNSFDKILLSEFIEHISEEEAKIVLNRAYDWLKPGGTIVIYTYPNRWARKAYPLYRFCMLIWKGITLPATPPDTIHPEYRKLHLNEQTLFSLWRNLKKSGFTHIRVWFDINPPRRTLYRMMWNLGGKYFLGTCLVAVGVVPVMKLNNKD
jgi:SAM-dependent methyltransferase